MKQQANRQLLLTNYPSAPDPGPWIKGVTLSDVYQMKKFLIERFGPDANIANVMPDDVFETEALRCGLSVIGPKETAFETDT